MKWIIIVIYYKVTWVYSVLSWVLPMTRFFKLAIAMWIMLPQFIPSAIG